MSVILLGYHNMGCAALKVLLERGITVPAVFTHRDDPGENRWFASLAEQAEEAGIPVYYPDNINAPEWVQFLENLQPAVLLSCYYRNMIKQEILDIPSIAAVNLHGSLLPRYRGRCPVNWQLIHGERKSGVTLHHMVVKADAGDIIAQQEVPVDKTDTAVDLFKKLELAAVDVLGEYIPRLLDGTAPRIPQDHSRASYFGGRKPDDGKIMWDWSAERIYNLVRAVTWPYPGAFFETEGCKFIVWSAEPLEEGASPRYPQAPDAGKVPGTVITIDRDDSAVITTGSGLIRLKTVSEAGEPPERPVALGKFLRPGMVLK